MVLPCQKKMEPTTSNTGANKTKKKDNDYLPRNKQNKKE